MPVFLVFLIPYLLLPLLHRYLVILAAAVIVVLNRHTMFKKGAGVTEVLMPEESTVPEN